MKVLIAEENLPLARVIQEMVKAAGCQFTWKSTEEDLLRTWQSSKSEFSLLVINASFGGKHGGGVQLAKRFQALQPKLGFLILGDNTSDQPEKFNLSKGVNFLKRPFLPRQVLNWISAYARAEHEPNR